MKDKLHKTGHKKGFYRFVSALKGIGFSLLAIAVLATPVAIAASVSAEQAYAEPTTSSVPEESVPETSSVE